MRHLKTQRSLSVRKLKKASMSVQLSQIIFCMLFYASCIRRPLDVLGRVIHFHSNFCVIHASVLPFSTLSFSRVILLIKFELSSVFIP